QFGAQEYQDRRFEKSDAYLSLEAKQSDASDGDDLETADALAEIPSEEVAVKPTAMIDEKDAKFDRPDDKVIDPTKTPTQKPMTEKPKEEVEEEPEVDNEDDLGEMDLDDGLYECLAGWLHEGVTFKTSEIK